jgi:hypothetical protein
MTGRDTWIEKGKGHTVKNSFKKVITFLTSCFVAFTISCAFNAYAAAPRPLTRLKANVKTRFNTVGKKFKSAGSTIKKGFSTAGTGIKRAAGTVKTTATGGFNALKTKAKVAGAGIKTVAGKAKTGITSAVGTVKAKAQTTFGKKPTPVTPATATTTSRAKTAPHELQEGDLAMFNESPTTSTATTTASRAKIKKAKTATTAAAEPAAQPAESATERMLRQQMRGQQIAGIVGAVGSTATGITSSVLAGIGQERAAVAAQQAGIGLTRAGQLGTQMYYQGVPITPEQAAQMGVSLTTAGTHIATAATGDQRYQIVGQQVASTIPTAVDLASRAPELVEQIPVLATKLQNMTETMARSLRNGFSSPVFDCTLASDGSSWNQDGDAPGVIRVGVVFNIGNPGFGPFGTPFMNVKGMPFVPEELERIKEVASKIPGLEGYSREIITGIEKFTKDINLPAIVVGGVRVVQLLANSVGSSATMVPSAAAAHALIGMYNVGKTLEIKMPVLEAGKRLSALELPSQRINRTIEELPLWLKLVVKEMVMLTELTITGTGPLPEYIEYSLLDKTYGNNPCVGQGWRLY